MSHNVCERINSYYGPNKTEIIAGFEGIPQNLVVNLVVWFFILCMFSIFRKTAWNYGRIAFLARSYETWVALFYSDVRRSVALTTLADEAEDAAAYYARRVATQESTVLRDEGFCSWICILLKLSNEDIERKAGPDAVYFLQFYKTLIIYTGITMVLCLLFVLPLNIHGVLKSPDLQQFGFTTISNIPGDSPMLWLHVSMGFLFFLIAFCLAMSFARRLHADQRRISSILENTLMISGVSRSNCKKDLIMAHFREAYPDCMVTEVQVAYDVRRLLELDRSLQNYTAALDYCRRSTERRCQQTLMIPSCCGAVALKCRICCGCFKQEQESVPVTTPILSETVDTNEMQPKSTTSYCCRSSCGQPVVDAVSFYSKSIVELSEKIQLERQRALSSPIGIAFVTFDTPIHAFIVRRDYLTARCNRRPHTSTLSKRLRSHRWSVDFAPTPNTLIWQNLALKRTVWWIRAAALNIAVFLIAFFLTTPLYVLNLMSRLQIPERLHLTNTFFIQIFPSIILWASSVLLPYCVYYSDVLTKHWTKTTLHFITMAKTNAMLLLMILILPSLGLTSLPALFQWLFPISAQSDIDPAPPLNQSMTTSSTEAVQFQTNTSAHFLEPLFKTTPPIVEPSFRWECIFMPDNGAFFVNYVITAGFIGSAFDLARLSELIMYAIRLLTLRSKAEKIAAQKAVLSEFDFGLNYAWLLCAFAVITANSILCPLITPFGFICLLLRYAVARYNIFFAYMPSRIDMRIHWLATSLMLACVLMLQLNIFMFIALRIRMVSQALAICTIVSFIAAIVWFLVGVTGGWIYVDGKATKRRANLHPVTNETPTAEVADNAPTDTFAPASPKLVQPLTEQVRATGEVGRQSIPADFLRGHQFQRTQHLQRPVSDGFVADYCPPVLCGRQPSTGNDPTTTSTENST